MYSLLCLFVFPSSEDLIGCRGASFVSGGWRRKSHSIVSGWDFDHLAVKGMVQCVIGPNPSSFLDSVSILKAHSTHQTGFG